MKTFKHFLLIAVSAGFLMTGCNDDDSVNNNPQAAEGEWKLINVSGSIAGTSYDFEPGTIAWTFNDNGTVTVVNYNENENAPDFFATSTYDFHFEPNEDGAHMCEESLFVDVMEMGCRTETETQLVLSQVWNDGYQLTFIK